MMNTNPYAFAPAYGIDPAIEQANINSQINMQLNGGSTTAVIDEESEKDAFRIEVTSKYPIKVCPGIAQYVQYKELSWITGEINALMTLVFDDYVGCRVNYDATLNKYVADLYYDISKPVTENGVRAFETAITNGKSNSLVQQISNKQAVEKNPTGRVLTREAREGLRWFMITPPNKVEWDKVTTTVPNNFGRYHFVIRGIDVTKIINKRIGTKIDGVSFLSEVKFLNNKYISIVTTNLDIAEKMVKDALPVYYDSFATNVNE